MADFSDIVNELKTTNQKLDQLKDAADPKGAAATEDKRDNENWKKNQLSLLSDIAKAMSGAAGGKDGQPSKENKKLGGIFAGVGRALGALGGGIGKGVGGFMKGMAAGAVGGVGFVKAMGFLGGGLAAFGVAIGAATWVVSKMMPSIARGLREFDGINGSNLAQVGMGIMSLGAGFTAMGAGTAIQGVGNLIGGIAEGIGGLFGVETGTEALVEKLKKFSALKLDSANIKNNSEAMAAYGIAMTAGGAGKALGAIGTLAEGGFGGLGRMFGAVPVVDSLKEFAKEKIDKAAVQNNAEAMASYTEAMALGAAAKGMEALGSIGNFVTQGADGLSKLIGGESTIDSLLGGLKKMSDASSGIVKANVSNVASAMVSYTAAMALGATAAVLQGVGSVGNLVTSATDGLSKLIGGKSTIDAMLGGLKKMSAVTDIDEAVVERNANAMVHYTKAMALGAGSSWATSIGAVGNLVGAAVDGIASFFGVKDADPLGDLKKFAATVITQKEVDQVKLNAEGVVAYAKAMTALAGMKVGESFGKALGSIFSGIGSLFGAKKEEKGPLEGLKSFAALSLDGEKIKKDITNLLSILEDKNISIERSVLFKNILTNIGDGLREFTKPGSFVDSLAGAAASVLSFLTGDKSPIQQIEIISANSEKLVAGSTAIEKIGNGLDKMAALKFEGDDIKLEKFAKDLLESVPLIETAIMGGKVEKSMWKSIGSSLFGGGDKTFLGLASGDIKWDQASKNIAMLRSAMGFDDASAQGVQPADESADAGFKMIDTMSVNTLVAQTLISNAIDRNAATRTPGGGGVDVTDFSTQVSSTTSNVSIDAIDMGPPDRMTQYVVNNTDF